MHHVVKRLAGKAAWGHGVAFAAFNVGVPNVLRTRGVPGLIPRQQKHDDTYCGNNQTQAIGLLLFLSPPLPLVSRHISTLLVVV